MSGGALYLTECLLDGSGRREEKLGFKVDSLKCSCTPGREHSCAVMADNGIQDVRSGPSKAGQLQPDTVLVLMGQIPDTFKEA
jgi:hypothetical protein